jgi:hypothetical protein
MATTHSELPTLSVDLVRAARRSEDLSRDRSVEDLASAVDRYLKWLRLIALHPEVPIAPTRDIDRMWHLHMLHPRAYADDCQRILGFLLDHDGGFGADAEEMPVLQRVFEETSALWESEYGEPYIGGAGDGMTKCARNCVSRCQRACKTVDSAPERHPTDAAALA